MPQYTWLGGGYTPEGGFAGKPPPQGGYAPGLPEYEPPLKYEPPPGEEDPRELRRRYDAYKGGGGGLTYAQWLNQGRPVPPRAEKEGLSWNWWLKENRWPWEEPSPGGAERGPWVPFTEPTAEAAPVSPRGPGPGPDFAPLGITNPEAAQAAYTWFGVTLTEVAPAELEAFLAQYEMGMITPGATRAEEEEGFGFEPLAPPEFPTTPPVEGYRWEYDSASMRYVLKPLPGVAPMTDYQREQIRMAEEGAAREQKWRAGEQAWSREQWEAQQEQQAWQQQWAQQEAQREQVWQQEQLTAQQQQQEQMLGWYREQAGMQQAEQERVERARLSAQPQSWLQYASYTGEEPVIQPWMKPLMPQEYGMGGGMPQGGQQQMPYAGMQRFPKTEGGQAPGPPIGGPYVSRPYLGGGGVVDLPPQRPWLKSEGGQAPGPSLPAFQSGYQVGQPIPGWTPESGAGMPTLTQPSRQYQARMGPTALQQYLGYRQARTGVRPEEEQWRLWSQTPPSGRQTGLRWTR